MFKTLQEALSSNSMDTHTTPKRTLKHLKEEKGVNIIKKTAES